MRRRTGETGEHPPADPMRRKGHGATGNGSPRAGSALALSGTRSSSAGSTPTQPPTRGSEPTDAREAARANTDTCLTARESDELLVDRLRGGDRAAFDEIYARYFKRVYAFLDKRLRNRADTEETTQEVFINIFSSIDGYRGDAPFAAWIFGLTRRTLAARFRKKRHPTVPLFEENDDVSYTSLTAAGQPDANPLDHYEYAERASRFDHVLEHELTPEQRRLFEMHHLESMPIAEIARTLSKSEDAVKSNLYRTRKLLLR